MTLPFVLDEGVVPILFEIDARAKGILGRLRAKLLSFSSVFLVSFLAVDWVEDEKEDDGF